MNIHTILIICICYFPIFSFSQENKEQQPNATIPSERISATDQSVKIDGTLIPLAAKAGTMQLRDENNEPIALFGYTSYQKKVQIRKDLLSLHTMVGQDHPLFGCTWAY